MENHKALESINPIPVFLSADNNYSPLIGTTILSIMENTESRVDFYVLDGGIFEDNKNQIQKLVESISNASIKFIKVDTQKHFKGFPTRMHFTIDMYTRFLIPALEPSLKRVIYTDVDVIFNDDIKKLYEEDLGDHALGAVPFIFGYLNPEKDQISSYHDRLKLSATHKYFESGLLLIDCEKWRKSNYTKKLIEKTKSCTPGEILTPDQDVFNIVFMDNYSELDNKYIVTPARTYLMKKDEKAKQSIIKPFIFHFTGAKKPWDYPEIEYAEYFWEYAKRTSFYKLLLFNLAKRTKLEQNLREAKRFSSLTVNEVFKKYRFKIWFTIFKVSCKYQDPEDVVSRFIK